MPRAAFLGLDNGLKKSIFASYVGLWVSSHLLVYSSKLAGAPEYNVTSAVMLTEAVKLCMAIGLYLAHDGGVRQLLRSAAANLPLALRYAVPAGLYCVYNNLVYVNLATFDPGTYNVLMQLRIVMTGGLYQVLFDKRLNRNQWTAVALIAAGCMFKESGKLLASRLAGGGGDGGVLRASSWGWLLLLTQMASSVLAGLYNEVLLKGVKGSGGGEAARLSTNLQNGFMYLNSIIFNGGLLLWQGRLGEATSAENLATLLSPRLLWIIGIMSTVGMVTGFFLKHLDSVLKAIASALEVVLTMIASATLFGTALDAPSILAAALVGSGVALYAQPVGRPADELAQKGADDATERGSLLPQTGDGTEMEERGR